MKIERKTDDMIELEGGVRIERHPVRRSAVATKELLSDTATASHYYAGKRKVKVNAVPQDKVGRDAKGKPIELGKAFDYIDWKSPDRNWTVYALEEVEETDKDGETVVVPRYLPKGTHDAEDKALSQAVDIAAARIKGS